MLLIAQKVLPQGRSLVLLSLMWGSTETSVRRSKVKLHSSLASLLGRKREEEDLDVQSNKSQKRRKGKNAVTWDSEKLVLFHPRSVNEAYFLLHFIELYF